MSTYQAQVENKEALPLGAVGGDPEEVGVFPLDEHNAKLLDLVAPRNWTNPVKDPDFIYDVVAIGAGAGGLVTSKQAARRGGKSALIERHLAGGDCLVVGCVPSKALLRCARALREARHGGEFGLVRMGDHVGVDFGKVMERMRRLRARIAPADSFSGAANVGVDVYQGSAKFTGPNTVEVAGSTLRFKKAVIATGGRAFVPNIPGLKGSPFLTNANLYNLTTLPPRMVVLGGGPVGSEMAQAFATFGTQVTIVTGRFLAKEDEDARDIVMEALKQDGVQFSLGSKITQVAHANGVFTLNVTDNETGETTVLETDQLLVATGRAPNVEGLGLDKAGVEYTARGGVTIDDFMQTSNPDVFAVGDVASQYQFTHMSGQMAIMVVDNILFDEKRKLSDFVLPWVTFTEPEVAHVGVYEADVKGGVDTYKAGLKHNDRAILEGADTGFFKIHCKKGTDQIIGGTIVAANAGEMLTQLTMCVQFGIPISHSGLGSVIYSYPTVASGVGSCMWGYKMKNWKTLVDGKVVGGEPVTEPTPLASVAPEPEPEPEPEPVAVAVAVAAKPESEPKPEVSPVKPQPAPPTACAPTIPKPTTTTPPPAAKPGCSYGFLSGVVFGLAAAATGVVVWRKLKA